MSDFFVQPVLEFLFIAETYNGTIFKQNLEDKSTIDPAKRNCFYDLCQIKSPVKRFSLVGKGRIFTVDLTDGHFELDGRTIATKQPPEKAALQLIYYHQVQQRMVITRDEHEEERKILKPVRRYFIGWKCTIDNGVKPKNYSFELGID